VGCADLLCDPGRLTRVVVCADEGDIHLNPRIGSDWMGPGGQRQALLVA
jgi:hypothetical protein